MAYIGNIPAVQYASFSKQTLTADSSTTSFTLDNAVANENELEVFVNNVRQEPGSGKAYTASGTTLTMSAAPTTGDTFYVIFQGKATQTVNPPSGSVGTAQIADGAITNSKVSSSAAIATTKLGAGAVLQVLNATDSTERTTTSTSFATGSNTLSVNITPNSTSSKFFVYVNTTGYNDTANSITFYTIFRDSTNLGASNGISLVRNNSVNNEDSIAMSVLDSPSTSSQITYQVYMKVSANTGTLNKGSLMGSITVMEIAG
jgi:hypothetical protein